MSQKISMQQVADELSKYNLYSEGIHLEKVAGQLSAVEDCGVESLVFISSKEHLELARKQGVQMYVVDQKVYSETDQLKNESVVVTKNVRLAHALIKQLYGDRDFNDSQWERVHASAIIHPSAQISDSAIIGPGVVIEENVQVGARVRIRPNVVIENAVCIGDDCVIHPNVTIGYGTKIGSRVIVEAGTVIGSEGFGFAQDEKHKSYRIPQTGNVVIEDDVRLGAGNCIDRATYGSTKIGRGTKTDNLCHFAHNVQIGEDCLLTAFFCIAGSSTVGDRVIASGQTGIIDHMNVCSDVVLVHRAGVTRDIRQPGMYAGLPTMPFTQYTKNISQFRNLSDMGRSLRSLEKGSR